MKSGCTVSVIRRRGVLPIVCALVLSVGYSEPSLAQTAQAYREQANALARSRSWEEAVAAYRRVLELEPNDAITHYNLALALKYKGDKKQAVEEFGSRFGLSQCGGRP